MSIMLPDDVAWVVNLLGFMWPEADEDKLRASAQAWRDFGADLNRINQDARAAATQVTAENTGDSIDSFARYWHGVGGGGGDFDRAKEASDHMALALEGMADLVEGVKIAVIAQLGILAAEIIADQLAAPETLGLSEGVAAAEIIVTRGIVRRIIQEGIHRIGHEIVRNLKGRVLDLFRRILATALRRAAIGALVAGGSDLGKQELDIYVFHSRTHVDLNELGAATGTGAVVGVITTPHGPKRDPLRTDRGDGRDPLGRFTGKGGYGKDGEAQGLMDYEDKYQRKVIPEHVRATTDGNNTRFYDGLALKPDGTYEGIEVKSGGATRDAQQRAFDNLINSGTPATAKLDGKTITITSVRLMEVDQ